jgi:hypothetical protein
MNGWSKNALKDVSINHVTGFSDTHELMLFDVAPNPRISNFIFTNNIVGVGKYQVWSAGGGSMNCANSSFPITSISKCFSTYKFGSNVIIGSPYPSSDWPAGNSFAKDSQAVEFLNYGGHDYSLLPSSPYAKEANDGTDPGANIEAVEEGTAGVY